LKSTLALIEYAVIIIMLERRLAPVLENKVKLCKGGRLLSAPLIPLNNDVSYIPILVLINKVTVVNGSIALLGRDEDKACKLSRNKYLLLRSILEKNVDEILKGLACKFRACFLYRLHFKNY
jgi:hypothetical protein